MAGTCEHCSALFIRPNVYQEAGRRLQLPDARNTANRKRSTGAKPVFRQKPEFNSLRESDHWHSENMAAMDPSSVLSLRYDEHKRIIIRPYSPIVGSNMFR